MVNFSGAGSHDAANGDGRRNSERLRSLTPVLAGLGGERGRPVPALASEAADYHNEQRALARDFSTARSIDDVDLTVGQITFSRAGRVCRSGNAGRQVHSHLSGMALGLANLSTRRHAGSVETRVALAGPTLYRPRSGSGGHGRRCGGSRRSWLSVRLKGLRCRGPC
jgi:hypothetical protein